MTSNPLQSDVYHQKLCNEKKIFLEDYLEDLQTKPHFLQTRDAIPAPMIDIANQSQNLFLLSLDLATKLPGIDIWGSI